MDLTPETIQQKLLDKKEEILSAKKKSQNPNVISRQIIEVNKLIYTAEAFHEYSSGSYSMLTENELKQLVKNHIGDDYKPSKFKDIRDSLITDCLVSVDDVNAFDKRINVANGILDLGAMELKPHSPESLFTIKLGAQYDPGARAPRWLRFLEDMLGDDLTKVDVLQEYFGYTLDFCSNNEKIAFLLGRGANGKSVCADVLKTVLGQNSYTVVGLDDFKKSHYIAMLFGKLVNVSTESNTKMEIYESVLKRLASSEEIMVDRKYGHPFKFKPTCKHIYSMNNLPRVADKTDAFFRRIIPIPFNRQVETEKRIFKYGELLGNEEGAGILNWMLKGRERLIRQRGEFSRSPQIDELLANYRAENNNVLDFVEEHCELSGWIKVTDLYTRYVEYCRADGVQPLKKRGFTSEVVGNFKVHRERSGSGDRVLNGINTL